MSEAELDSFRYNVPNLDCMDRRDLIMWWREKEKTPLKCATALFPDKPPNYRNALLLLTKYAYEKATAIRCRELGYITEAMRHEKICDDTYLTLPGYARW